MSDRAVEPVARRDLVLRRYAKTGWIVIGIGLLIPVLAAAGAYRGWRLVRWGRSSEGIPLLVVGLVVFVARLALWANTGFNSAF
jgi:hypothetical protein